MDGLLSVCKPCHNYPVHGGKTLLISGTADNAIFSDNKLRPPQYLPASEPTCIELEVEPPSEKNSDQNGSSPATATTPPTVPHEITPAWWHSHQHMFEWSERKGLLAFHPERELEVAAEEAVAQTSPVVTTNGKGIPRNLISLLCRARDLAQLETGIIQGAVITKKIALEALRSLGIDSYGLTRMDRKILKILVQLGHPTGLQTLADHLGVERRTVAELYEPYLILEGFLIRTFRGRIATGKARQVDFRE